MRIVHPTDITNKVKEAIIQSNYVLDDETLKALRSSQKKETSEMGLYVLDEVLDNARIAGEQQMPLCQDTGVSVFFVKWGSQCVLQEGTIQTVLNEAVREAYQEGYLRKSILKDPLFDRSNTGDNTPAYVHLEQVEGDQVTIEFLAKGAGADNCSRMTMLKPADGLQGVKDFVLKVCREAGADSCPPWIIGVGVGGTFDTVTSLAKHALMRTIGSRHEDQSYADLEQVLFEDINAIGIGPQGLGGKTTALAVFIESNSCHAASLPVAVNIQCHSNRKFQILI
ncbi:MAG: fumarate hydratase [Candidatus Altimarinota bacterium]